jgi:hypothetical protein
VDARAFASPKRLRPRRRVKPGHDGGKIPRNFIQPSIFSNASIDMFVWISD